MYARIGIFDVRPSQLEAVVEHFRSRAVEAFSEHDGFLGYQAFIDRERGRVVGISRWTSRTALERSSDSARKVLERAAELGAALVGEPQIVEEAFDAGPTK